MIIFKYETVRESSDNSGGLSENGDTAPRGPREVPATRDRINFANSGIGDPSSDFSFGGGGASANAEILFSPEKLDEKTRDFIVSQMLTSGRFYFYDANTTILVPTKKGLPFPVPVPNPDTVQLPHCLQNIAERRLPQPALSIKKFNDLCKPLVSAGIPIKAAAAIVSSVDLYNPNFLGIRPLASLELVFIKKIYDRAIRAGLPEEVAGSVIGSVPFDRLVSVAMTYNYGYFEDAIVSAGRLYKRVLAAGFPPEAAAPIVGSLPILPIRHTTNSSISILTTEVTEMNIKWAKVFYDRLIKNGFSPAQAGAFVGDCPLNRYMSDHMDSFEGIRPVNMGDIVAAKKLHKTTEETLFRYR